MNTLTLSELQELLAKEYARFTMLVQYQECDLLEDDADEAGCEDDDCETDCCGSCEESCGGETDEDEEIDGADFDPYEYALLFSTLRITVYLQHIIQGSYEKAHPKAKESTFEENVRWLLAAGFIKTEDDLNELAVLFAFFDETVQPYSSKDVLCYTQDSDRLPSLPLEQTVSAVELGVNVVQHLVKGK